ncbi:MAG: hypothetical protein ACD_75C02326G0001, partial [uncultured bacterium]
MRVFRKRSGKEVPAERVNGGLHEITSPDIRYNVQALFVPIQHLNQIGTKVFVYFKKINLDPGGSDATGQSVQKGGGEGADACPGI